MACRTRTFDLLSGVLALLEFYSAQSVELHTPRSPFCHLRCNLVGVMSSRSQSETQTHPVTQFSSVTWLFPLSSTIHKEMANSIEKLEFFNNTLNDF